MSLGVALEAFGAGVLVAVLTAPTPLRRDPRRLRAPRPRPRLGISGDLIWSRGWNQVTGLMRRASAQNRFATP